MSFYFTRTIHQKGGVVKSQWCGRNKENVYQLYASSLKKKNLLEKKVDQEQCSVSNFMIIGGHGFWDKGGSTPGGDLFFSLFFSRRVSGKFSA